MLLLLPFVSLLLSTTSAIFPSNEDRFIDNDHSFKVPNASVDYKTLSYNTIVQNNNNKIPNINKDSQSYSNSSSTILNLIPGISLLQTDVNNECYWVNTIIGQEEYPLIIDTGSAYLWVYGEHCTDPPCEQNKVYSSSSASNSDQPTSTFALAYVTGSAIGDVVEDNIIVNKLATTQSFKFGMAKTVPEFFVKYPVSGVFGLPSNDSSSIESIISALYDSHAIGIKRFSILIGEINPNDNQTFPNSGIFAIGEPVKELFIGDIHNVPLIPNKANYWLILIDSIIINDSIQVSFTNTTEVNINGGIQYSNIIRQAIVDSGTTVLAIPKQDAIDLHAYFENSITDGTNFAILCNSQLILNLKLNGKLYSIYPNSYLGPAYPQDSEHYGYCVSNIQGIDSETWILGAVFLKSVYADFNVEDQQIGFAQRNTEVILTSTSTSESSQATSSASITTSVIDNSAHTTSNTTSTTSGSHKSSNAGIKTSLDFSILTILSAFLTMTLL